MFASCDSVFSFSREVKVVQAVIFYESQFLSFFVYRRQSPNRFRIIFQLQALNSSDKS